MARRLSSIVYPKELARRLYPEVPEAVGVKRVYRGIAANAIPGVVRLNKRRYAFSRAALRAWLDGRNGNGEQP